MFSFFFCVSVCPSTLPPLISSHVCSFSLALHLLFLLFISFPLSPLPSSPNLYPLLFCLLIPCYLPVAFSSVPAFSYPSLILLSSSVLFPLFITFNIPYYLPLTFSSVPVNSYPSILYSLHLLSPSRFPILIFFFHFTSFFLYPSLHCFLSWWSLPLPTSGPGVEEYVAVSLVLVAVHGLVRFTLKP